MRMRRMKIELRKRIKSRMIMRTDDAPKLTWWRVAGGCSVSRPSSRGAEVLAKEVLAKEVFASEVLAKEVLASEVLAKEVLAKEVLCAGPLGREEGAWCWAPLGIELASLTPLVEPLPLELEPCGGCDDHEHNDDNPDDHDNHDDHEAAPGAGWWVAGCSGPTCSSPLPRGPQPRSGQSRPDLNVII
jgi:hypothetical protein